MRLMSWRSFNWLCVIVVLAVLGIRTWGHRGVNKAWTLPAHSEMNDFGVNTSVSAQLIRDPEHRYWSDFAYPPSAVVFWYAFEKLGYPAGDVAWLAILGTSLVGAFLLALRITGRGPAIPAVFEPPSGIILALAFAATEYYCLWDLHVVNTNSVYLFLVLGGVWAWLSNRPVVAGFLLGASVALKIYSIFFLPFLLLRRQWRVTAAMLLGLAFFFVAVPIFYFGFAGALEITRNWLHTILSAGGPDYMIRYSGYKVSLAWIVTLLLDPRASDGQLNVMNWSPEAVIWLLRFIHTGWLLLVLGYFVGSRPLPFDTQRGRLALALDTSMLLLLPLPLSPFLQPPHPVVLLFPSIALLRYSFECRASMGKRVAAALTVASGVFVELAHFPWRGAGVMLNIAVFFAGICIVRRDLMTSAESAVSAPNPPAIDRESASEVRPEPMARRFCTR